MLERFDLRLEPGARVALVGPSGAGKTTVTNLLLRFLDPEAGRVTIGGRDLRELRQEDVRRTFALAGQEAHVFDSTIRENLRLARPQATDEELVDALRRARLDEWVESLPDGLDTLVGEEGTQLSGGQRQRLVVARALLSEAPVLLLDEPTAHLDPETAEALVDGRPRRRRRPLRPPDHAPPGRARPLRRGRRAARVPRLDDDARRDSIQPQLGHANTSTITPSSAWVIAAASSFVTGWTSLSRLVVHLVAALRARHRALMPSLRP